VAGALTGVPAGASSLAGRERRSTPARGWRIFGPVASGVVRNSLASGEHRSRLLRRVGIELMRFGASSVENVPLSRIRGIDDVRVEGPVLRHGLLVLCALSALLECESVFAFGPKTDELCSVLAHNLPAIRIHRFSASATERPLGALQRDTFDPSRITQLTGDPDIFDFSPYSGAIDLVHIDGGDADVDIRAETDAAFSLLSELGTIVWDNYPHSSSAYAYLNKLAPALDRQVFHILGTRLALYSRWDIVRPAG
jgi:hypothetical protein